MAEATDVCGLQEVRAALLYCEQQVEEAGAALDGQWEEHTARLKRTVRWEGRSVREELSLAALTQHTILQQQQARAADLASQLTKLQDTYPLTFGSPRKGKAETELDKLAESLKEKSSLTPKKRFDRCRSSF